MARSYFLYLFRRMLGQLEGREFEEQIKKQIGKRLWVAIRFEYFLITVYKAYFLLQLIGKAGCNVFSL